MLESIYRNLVTTVIAVNMISIFIVLGLHNSVPLSPVFSSFNRIKKKNVSRKLNCFFIIDIVEISGGDNWNISFGYIHQTMP
jgi:hypothetical protein